MIRWAHSPGDPNKKRTRSHAVLLSLLIAGESRGEGHGHSELILSVLSEAKDLARNLLFLLLSSSTFVIEDPVSFLYPLNLRGNDD